MKLIKIMAVGITMLMASGCVLTNPTDPYAEVNLAYDRDPQGGDNNKSNDEKKLTSALTLEEAVDFALNNNPGLAAVKRDVSAAEARSDAAVSGLWPDVRASTSYTKHVNEQPLTSVTGNVQGKTFTDELSEAQVSMQMPLFTSGRISSRIDAAQLGKKASVHKVDRSRRELHFNVVRTFFDILAQKRVVESAQFSQKALKEHLKQVQHRIENQKATKVERLRTEVRLANVREELARARNILEVKRHTLAKLLGIDNKSDLPEIEDELQFNDKSPQPIEDILPKAYEEREDYLAARKELEAQAKQVDTSRAELWPSVTLEGAYGDRWDGSSMGDAEDVGQLGVMLSLPLFEGGRLRAEIQEEKAELAAAQERLNELEHTLRLEVQTARSNVSTARERVNATRKAVNQGKESLRVERATYRAGEATVTDVLDAQADLLQSQTSYHRALADYNTALVELNLAIGMPLSKE